MNRKPKRILLIVVLFVALLGLAGGVYFGTYSRATPEAAALLQGSDAVEVKAMDKGWLLDGPGTEAALVFYPAHGPCRGRGGLLPSENAAEHGLYGPERRRGRPGGLCLRPLVHRRALPGRGHGRRLRRRARGGAFGPHPPGATKPLDQHLAVLELHGSEDGVLNRDKLEQGRQYLPSSALAEELPGGNHAQFGDYGPQKGDGAATVSREEQTRWAVDRIEGMILGK